MCKEDVRIGRKKVGRRIADGVLAGSDAVPIAQANPNRATLVVSIVNPDGATHLSGVVLLSGSATGPVLATLTDLSPTWSGRVEEYGDGVTSSVYSRNVGANDPELAVAEYQWLQTLEDI